MSEHDLAGISRSLYKVLCKSGKLYVPFDLVKSTFFAKEHADFDFFHHASRKFLTLDYAMAI